MSPAMAAATAILGHFSDIRDFDYIDSVDKPKLPLSSAEELERLQIEKRELDEDLAEPAAPHDGVDDNAKVAEEISSEQSKDGKSSGMEKFVTLTSVAAPLTKENIDTDAIIPKQFLKTIKRTGLRKGLFYESRFAKDANGKMVPTDFVLNVDPYTHAKILVVTGKNFGCGSSREHAPWALKDFGIRSIIAPSFGDIFYNNSFKNGLLPIRLPQEVIEKKLYPLAVAKKELTVDLPNQQIKGPDGSVLVDNFDVEDFRKHCLLNGLDDIGITLQKVKFIDDYEKIRKSKFSFLEGGSKRLISPVREVNKSIHGAKESEW